jgi:hypothetical protein
MLLDITPAYIVDIRNEFKHIPAFVSFQHFQYWLLDKSINKHKYIKPPLKKDYYKDGQYRFVFNTQREYLALYKLMLHFRNCTIVYDEADAIFTDNHAKKIVFDVFLGSRNNNVTLYFIGKRPIFIPLGIRSQADAFTIFCIEEEYDINYLSRRVKQSFPKDVYKLERGEAIIIKSGEKPRVEQFDKFKGE